MTTMTSEPGFVTGGVDTHLDTHVASALDHLGGVLGTASFPTTSAGYVELLDWLRRHGPIDRVGIEGTGSYGSGLAQHLRANAVSVIEVSRPSRQVRRRHGKSDVIDAIAAARAVLAGEATTVPKSHDGSVEALRTLKLLQRSANKARVVALNQLHNLVVTAPDELRTRLRDLGRNELLSTCRAFRIRTEDDTLDAITRFSMRELARPHRSSRRPAGANDAADRSPDPGVGAAVAGDQRRGTRRCLDAARHYRRQPRADASREELRQPLRHLTHPGQQRQTQPASTQPRRRPPGERRALASRDRAHGHR